MKVEKSWNDFLKTGSISAYLSYVQSKKIPLECINSNERPNKRPDNKGNAYRGK